MKKLLFIFAISSFVGFAQDNLNNTVFERGSNSAIQISYKNENIGSPYLFDKWTEGYIVINDSIISSQDGINLNLESGELIISSGKNNQTGVIITDKTVTGFALEKDVKSTQKLFFARIKSSDFVDRNRSTKFYEVISNLENSNYLIKEESKYLFDPNKSRGYQTQNSIPQEYKTRKAYYLKGRSGKYVKTKLSKKSILKNLGDKKGELKAYISSKNINFNKEHDIVRVLNYYHSL